MKNNLTWISVPLFCCKSKWHSLLADAISPFVTDNDLVGAYSLKFNDTGRENIRFSLLAKEKKAGELKKTTNTYFANWFLKADLVAPQIIQPEKDTIQIPLSSDSAQFELYPSGNTIVSGKENHALSIGLSQITLNALKEDLIDDETLLTFAFYLQMALIKIVTHIDPTFRKTLKPKIQSDIETKEEITDSLMAYQPISEIPTEIEDEFLIEKIVINKKFEEDKKILSEIARDIFLDSNAAHKPKWLEQWDAVCKSELNRHPTEVKAIVYNRIVDEIYQLLGLTSQTTAILSFFIQRIIQVINPPEVIIVGAEKCGTSSLHATLLAHSKIKCAFDPEDGGVVKEVNFFSYSRLWSKGIDWYFSHFALPGGIDATPHYVISKTYCQRMHTVVPNAKLLMCIRNPVERAFSQYNHYRQEYPRTKAWDWLPDKDFSSNIKIALDNIKTWLLEDGNTSDSMVNFDGLVLRGVYVKQIKQLLNYYDMSQIYITVTDWWPKNYESELVNIQRFLGREIEALPPRIVNKREYTVEPFDQEAKQLLTEFYKPYNQELFEFLGYEIPEWN